MKKINKLETLSQAEIDRIIEMGWEDRTTFEDIRVQFGLLEKEVIVHSYHRLISNLDECSESHRLHRLEVHRSALPNRLDLN